MLGVVSKDTMTHRPFEDRTGNSHLCTNYQMLRKRSYTPLILLMVDILILSVLRFVTFAWTNAVGHCFSYCLIKKPDYNSISFFHKQELMSYKGDLKTLFSNLYYARCITPKRLTSSLGPFPRFIGFWSNKAPFEEMSQRWRAVGNSVFDLTGRRYILRSPPPKTNALEARTFYILNSKLCVSCVGASWILKQASCKIKS